jgi:uncharacterized repeat protein (TIGR04138 family)
LWAQQSGITVLNLFPPPQPFSIHRMQTVSFQEAVKGIVDRDPRYSPEAYEFIRDGLEFTIKKARKVKKAESNDIPTAELLDGLRLYALKEFGPMAMMVLDYWGIRECEDFGQIVFLLVEAGVFSKTDNDTLDEFRRGYSFEEAFLGPFRPTNKNLSKSAPAVVQAGA